MLKLHLTSTELKQANWHNVYLKSIMDFQLMLVLNLLKYSEVFSKLK